MKINLNDLSRSVCDLATDTGRFIHEESMNFKISMARSKGLHDFVSYVDIEAENRLTKRLSELLPGSGFITEEGTASGKGEKYTWVIDPLDGTTNFMHGLHPYSVSIALREGNKVILGVIYIASSGELFQATAGGGAWLNGNRINTSEAQKVENSLVATGFPYWNFSRLEGFMKCLEYFIRNSHGVRRMGSAAVDLAFVACGRFDAFFEYNLNPWDVSAGLLLVREAGGRVSDFSGNEDGITGKEMVATNGYIFDEFSGIVGKYMRE